MLESSSDEYISNKQSSCEGTSIITSDSESSLPPQNAGCIFIPSHLDLGCEPRSFSNKSDLRIMGREGAGSLCIPTHSRCSLSTVITSSNMLEEPFPPSSQLPSGSKDNGDGGSSMAVPLTRLVESGAQDSNNKIINKFPSNINNHNINNIKDEIGKSRSTTPVDRENIPVNDTVSNTSSRTNKSSCTLVYEYKLRWGIPLQCGLYGGGESSLNTNNPNWTASNNINGAVGASSSNNNAAIPPTSANWSNSQQSASASGSTVNSWPSAGSSNGTNPASNNNARQQNTPNISSSPNNNASHPSNASQNMGNNSPVSSSTSNATNNTTGTPTSWAQAAGKNLPVSSASNALVPPSNSSVNSNTMPANSNQLNNSIPPNGNSNNSNSNSTSGNNNSNNCSAVNGNGSQNSTTKQQLEQLNSMREALFSQDGWGGQHVNQDSTWDVPASPEPAQPKDASGAPIVPWKPNVNNGTDLWETNLRNGGQPPPAVQKTPWGHTPATNIGGTWGEDDDVAESSNVWTNNGNSNVNPVQQWGSVPSNQTPMWGNKKDEWNSSGSNWNDPRDMNRNSNGMDPRSNVDVSHMRPMMDHRNINNDGMMRGDPRGITGRLNGTPASEPMWNGPPQQATGPGPHHVNASGPPVPPAQGSKLVPQGPNGGGNKVTNWKEMPGVNNNNMSRSGIQCPPGTSLQQSRLSGTNINSTGTGGSGPGLKPDQQVWGHPSRNGTWGDNGPHDMNQSWADDKIAPWNEATLSSWSNTQKPKTPMTPGGWVEGEADPSSWGHPTKMGPKALTKDIVWASKQFRILTEMNFKKEDVENALRASNMVLEDALEYLNATRCNTMAGNNVDTWRRNENEPHPFDHSANQTYPSHRLNPQQQLPFALAQTVRATNNASTSPQQLRILLQHIQVAVNAGYLNHQILNQPLAPQTLLLVNQLLQQIKTVQQLQQHQAMMSQSGLNVKNNATFLTLGVQINKCKHQIQTLQNQIATQQAIFMKQQHINPTPSHLNVSDYFKSSQQDPLCILQNSFNDISLNKDSQMLTQAANFQNQQSRLTQWKLPSLEKDDMPAVNEFSRAPGTTMKNMQNPASPNLNIIGQNESTWSVSGRCESTWPDTVQEMQENKDWNQNTVSASNFTDLVPEFEPGKPWKGSQMKNIEDDPTITPGSVVRSPLSLAAIKDSDIFSGNSSNSNNALSGKTSPSSVDIPLTPLTISSSTWSYNTSSGTTSFTSPIGKLNNNGNSTMSKGSWGDISGGIVSGNDMWGMSRSRGPPPGLGNKNSPMNPTATPTNANGWGSLASPRWQVQNLLNPWAANSSWLLLRNITPQVDASTLKTLCMQHGPVQNFHLFLNHGIAVARYNSREEASKALGALNNCILANTTIHVESPAEADVQNLLQQLQVVGSVNWGQPNNQNNKRMPGSIPIAGAPTASVDNWNNSGVGSNQIWPSNLWGAGSGLDNSDPHRATPSSLNSFLPGDLLGGESM